MTSSNSLQQVGIRAELRPLERAAFFKGYADKKFRNLIQDGAGRLATFWYVTLPLLRPVLGTVILYSVVMTISDFETIYLITRGGPRNTTHLFSTLAYQVGLVGTEIGLGAAIVLFIFPVLAVAAFLLIRLVRQSEQIA